MAEKPETLTDLKKQFPGWRAQRSDLPVILSMLSFLKDRFYSYSEQSQESNAWQDLRRRGSQLARRQALFIAAEATGYLPSSQKGTESQTIINDLGVVINEGNSLHKVRALRAMKFIASEECIPFLEQGLQDSSPWVQATALQTLFRLNLRQKKPRRVFQSFLISTFRRGLTRNSLFSASDYNKTFFLNKGLFVSLIKEPGRIPLACICLLLWLTSTVLKTAIPLIVVAAVLAALVPLAIFMIVDMPFWVRRALTSNKVPSTRHVLLAILDYGFILLFLREAQLSGSPQNHWALVIFYVFHVFTLVENKNRFSEDLRTLNRFLLTVVTTHIAMRVGESRQTVLVIGCIAATQLIWVLPGLIPMVVSKRERIKKMGAEVLGFPRALAAWSWSKLLQLLREVALIVRTLRRLRLITISVLIFLAVPGYFALISLEGGPQERIRFQLGNLFIILKPYLYLTLGLLVLLIYSLIVSSLVHLVWDELLYVERIRFQTLARRPSHFNSMGEFVAYVIRAVKDASSPVGIRVRAVLALGQVPLANATNINQLMDLAEDENLPPKVRDTLFQIVDAAEKRLQRGQSSTLSVDMDLVNHQIDPLWSPGSLLRRSIRFGLMALLLLSIVEATMLWFTPSRQLTESVTLVQLVLGAAFLLYYILTLGVMSNLRKWLLIISIGLLLVSLAHPFESILTTWNWPKIFINFGVEFIDQKTLWALFVPTLLFIIGAQVGHTVFLLDSDVPINSATEASRTSIRPRSNTGILYYIEQRTQRLRFQSFVVLRVLFIGIIFGALQSEPLQELANLQNESMPVFALDPSDGVRRLENIPLDGRLIRIAIIQPENENQAPFLDQTFPFGISRQVGLVYEKDPTCFGEIWISARSGHLEAWNTLPEGCLDVPTLNGDTATFDLEALCRFHYPIRLVAMVYNRSRSEEVKKRANPANVASEVLAASASRPKVLVDTLSPFVRGVWSTPFTSKSRDPVGQ